MKIELKYILKTLFSLCLVGLIVIPLLPLASAHGVCTGLQPRFGRLDDVNFSSQSIQTGYTITITGDITSLVKPDLQGYLSIHSSPSPHGRWTMISIEPSGKMINVTQFSRVPFSMTIKALQPGTYKLSPVLYLPEIGPAFSMLNGCNTEPLVTVTGDPICNQGFVAVSKAEDGSSFCVKPNTANILLERGWAEPMTGRITQTNDTQNMKNHDPFGITALVIYKPSSGCLSDGCSPNDFYLKINSNSAAYLLGYNICDGDSCTKSNDLSVLLPLNSGLKPDYQMIGLPVNLQWKYGDAINIQLEISSTLDNKTGLLVDIGNSIIVPQ
ncbi:MAG: hypothetical protein ACREA8_09485 [Nitrosotalea sp.]